MCLITEQLEPIILDEDLIVYKALKRGFLSPYQYFRYNPGQLYEMKNVRIIYRKLGNPYDNIVIDWLNKRDESNEIIYISHGYHAALTPERLGEERYECCIYQCIYPKGSIVYKDSTGLCVSNKIIITTKLI